MKIDKIKNGIFQSFTTKTVGNERIDTMKGIINGKEINVYSEYTDGKLSSKLYYLEDQAMNWLHFKLLQFKDGKVIRKLDKNRLDVYG